MIRPCKEHYIIVRKGEEEIYKKVFIGNDEYLDAEFYENLALKFNKDDGTVLETQVDFQKFFKEWWRNIAQQDIFVSIAKGMQDYICLSNEAEMIDGLMSFKYTEVGKFFSTLEDISNIIEKNKEESSGETKNSTKEDYSDETKNSAKEESSNKTHNSMKEKYSDKTENSTEDQYKLYIVVKYNVENVAKYYSFIKALNKYKKNRGI